MLLKWTKRRLKVALAVLDAVKSRFLETQEFIENTVREECEKEKITPDKVIFYKFRSKKLAWINIFVLDLVLFSDYFFCLQMWKGLADTKKTKRLSKVEIKK